MAPQPTSLLTTAQAAAYLGLQPQTLRKWRFTGEGPPYIRLGDSPRARVAYRVEDINSWLAARAWRSTSAETVARSVRR
jgi:predicted DNA-binding transcriptional regulator AlpA